jgi:alpha,alpha-trehalose phosphorylase
VLALLLASDEFTREEKRRDFEYYDALTTGDSTLSAVVQSIIAAEVGYRELAYRYFEHALRVDLDDLHHNSADGVHIASCGGVWMTLVQGFAGMRDAGRRLSFDPRLPGHWGSLSFSLAWRGEQVEIRPGAPVEVALEDQGDDLGPFRGLSAGILPREGDTGVLPVLLPEVPTVTTSIPTLPAEAPARE